MEKKIRIHLADDHQILIDGMRTLLHTVPNYTVVGHSLNGKNIYDDIIANKADILVLDINMPEKDGIEVIKELYEKGLPCKIIILSSYDDRKIIEEVMKLGASGYLTKQCAGENIVEAIQFVARDEVYFCNITREKLSRTTTEPLKKINKEDKLSSKISLSGREIEIITLIAQELSGKEISERLFISTNTVETHRKNIMKKLKAKNSISLVKYALKHKFLKS
jgi:DNA-binding NarL/FixJ family response regulator